jgi:transcription termination factor Rho
MWHDPPSEGYTNPPMSSESEDTNESNVPAELDLGDSPEPPKKVARKAARKAAKKVAKKIAKEKAPDAGLNSEPSAELKTEFAPPKEESSEFRPVDFKGRGSHFDDVDKIEVVRDVLKEKGDRDAPEKSSNSDTGSDRDDKHSGNEDREKHSNKRNQPHRHKNQGGNRHQNKQGQHPNQKNRSKNQKGGHRQNQQDRKGGGGWKQPLPPKETDHVGGVLPDAARYKKFEDVKAILDELGEIENPVDLSELYELSIDQGRLGAESLGVVFEEKPSRKQIIEEIFKLAAEKKLQFKDAGFLDVSDEGHGFVVHAASNYQLKPESVYIPASLINHYSLKRGHEIEVIATAPQEGERCPASIKIVSVMGGEPESIDKVPPFEDLIPYYPTERFVLETPLPSNSKKDVSMRAFDILTPIGLGQRGLIVAPPRTGKTILLQGLAHSVQENYPNAHLIVLLIDERPEEVTDFRRKVTGEVVSSTFDETPSSHVHAAEMVVEKARRMVEAGKDVVILLDSITRLARAYNALASNSGKIMSGGIEATALQKPKRFFGSARNIEEAGSLTIMGTALVDTGSKMDEVIFEEFKGTGNMEIHLDRDLINKRVFPAINFERSGTRKEELLYHPQELEKVYGLRRVMQGVPGVEAMEMLIKRLKATKSNAEFLMSLK